MYRRGARRRADAAPTAINPAATRKATVSPKASADPTPHGGAQALRTEEHHLVDGQAASRTQAGKKSWSEVLTVASTPTQAIPVGTSTITTATGGAQQDHRHQGGGEDHGPQLDNGVR